jgi:hypothetical protein
MKVTIASILRYGSTQGTILENSEERIMDLIIAKKLTNDGLYEVGNLLIELKHRIEAEEMYEKEEKRKKAAATKQKLMEKLGLNSDEFDSLIDTLRG